MLPILNAMDTGIVSTPLLLGAASEFWATRWLTTFWLLGLGVCLGFVALGLFYLLFLLLSRIPGIDSFRKSGLAFGSTIVISGLITAGLSIPIRWSFGSNFQDEEWNEWLLLVLASWPLVGIVVGSLLYCSQTRFIGELGGVLFRGIGAWIFGLLLAIGLLGLAIWPLVDEPLAMLQSIPSLIYAGETRTVTAIPGNTSDSESSEYVPLKLRYDATLVDSIRVESDRNIILSDAKSVEEFASKPVRVEARTPLEWNRRSTAQAPISLNNGANVFAQNLEIDEAKIVFTLTTVPPHPEVMSIIALAISTMLIGLAWMLQQAAAPKLSAIALAAAKSELSQPLPIILMLIGSILLYSFVFLPFHTEGEDIKMLKDCGLTLILILALFQGIWSASSTVSDEIEGRTALTLLSKPIHRRSFIIGKMLGIFWVLLFMFLVLGTIFLLTVAYKPIYDARETSADMPLWQGCHVETMRAIPGLIMGYLQAVTLSAIAIALATRVPQLANFAICFSLYLVGHLNPTIVNSRATEFPILQFIAQLIAVLVPTLDWYSMDKAIDTGHAIPLVYLAGVMLYSLAYTAFAVLLGLLFFEDRDLA